MIAPYPPGIPVVYPGEIITDGIWEYLEQFKKDGRHIHGLEGDGVKILTV
jgi:arginine/lysine/ornithine decarboxylase